MPGTQMTDIFITYAREDRDKAKTIGELFQQQDWSVWWDRNIPPSRSFDEVIEEALGAAKCVVVLWLKNSASADWVKGEAEEGFAGRPSAAGSKGETKEAMKIAWGSLTRHSRWFRRLLRRFQAVD